MDMQMQFHDALEALQVRLKLASLWASFMFLYIYVDYFYLYMPGKLESMMQGKVFTFTISSAFLVFALISVTLPALMIFLSAALPAHRNRQVNLWVAGVNIPYALFNLVGETWPHLYIAAAVEVALLCLIIAYARSLPKVKA